jgi:predicted SprT family Zn-dependent metalloprotease
MDTIILYPAFNWICRCQRDNWEVARREFGLPPEVVRCPHCGEEFETTTKREND